MDVSDPSPGVDMDDIELYGFAIHGAKMLRDREWCLTDEGYLIPEDFLMEMPLMELCLSIDENVSFLSSLAFKKEIKNGTGFRVDTSSLCAVDSAQDGFRCRFIEKRIGS
ncbi:MAG: hypothetical protein BMS9Abin13_675 [Patescibacteria group bacterium]|nr:MAG: hypothetical protein BMS9Abin13_675 [Patescibacteria group bacterium]